MPEGRPDRRQDRSPGRPASPQGDARRAPSVTPIAAEHLIYGINPVREALRGRRRVSAVWVLAGTAARSLDRSVREWSRQAGVQEPRIIAVPVEELVVRSGTLDHQGIVAELEP